MCVWGVVLLCCRDLNPICSPKSWRMKSVLGLSQLMLNSWCLLKWEMLDKIAVLKNTDPIIYYKNSLECVFIKQIESDLNIFAFSLFLNEEKVKVLVASQYQ